jgi:two-component system, OmpR family, response regulator
MNDGGRPLGKILIVDDDPDVRETVGTFFAENDLPTYLASNGVELERQLTMNDPSLIILDLKLGEENGLDLLRSLRSQSDIPIIIMTGCHLAEIDRIIGLELGADDYIAKPFSLRELLARARGLLRRRQERRTKQRAVHVQNSAKRGYKFGVWRLELENRRLFGPNETRMPLTRGQYALLLAFLKAPRRVLSREKLTQLTRMQEDIDGRSIDIQVLRLRRKLGVDRDGHNAIRTVRGAGYVFALQVQSF